MRYDAAKKHHKSIVKIIFQKKLKKITKKLDFQKSSYIYYKKRFMVKGSKHTEETKEKISKAMKGRTFSEESRKKIGEGIARWYAENTNSETELNRRAKLSAIAKERMRVWNEYLENENSL